MTKNNFAKFIRRREMESRNRLGEGGNERVYFVGDDGNSFQIV